MQLIDARYSAPSYIFTTFLVAVLYIICRIAKASKRNLRRALLMCQTCWVHQQTLSPNQEIMEPDWEIYLRETANLIVSEQTPARLLEVRQRIYELLTRCIPSGLIMKVGNAKCSNSSINILAWCSDLYTYAFHWSPIMLCRPMCDSNSRCTSLLGSL